MLTSLLAIICTIHIQMWVQTCTTDFFDNLHAPLSISVSLEEVVNLSYTSQLIFKLTIVESFSNYPRSELFKEFSSKFVNVCERCEHEQNYFESNV